MITTQTRGGRELQAKYCRNGCCKSEEIAFCYNPSKVSSVAFQQRGTIEAKALSIGSKNTLTKKASSKGFNRVHYSDAPTTPKMLLSVQEKTKQQKANLRPRNKRYGCLAILMVQVRTMIKMMFLSLQSSSRRVPKSLRATS